MFGFMVRVVAFSLLVSCLTFAQKAPATPVNEGELQDILDEVYGPNPGQVQPVKSGGNSDDDLGPGQPNQNVPQKPEKPIKPPIDLNPTTGDDEDITCLTEENQEGECVQYYLCDGNNTIITNGNGIIDIRVRDGPCKSYMEVCCLTPDRVSTPITPPPPIKPNPTGCGYRNPDGVKMRIKGAEDGEANFGEFNWMVAILREEPVEGSTQKLNVYQCGGSLIHPRVVLTGAHCVHSLLKTNPNPKLKIRVGEWDTQTKDEIIPHQDREVSRIVEHPDFLDGVLFNDMALLFLTSPVENAENVGTICLPSQGEVLEAGARCFASGWGKDTFGKEGRYQVILKKVELPLVDRSVCQNWLRKTRLGKYYILDKSFVCAGGEEGKDTCKGDGGSPLVCRIPYSNEPERYVQVGTVAWGIGCGGKNIPGVYGNVGLFRNWIDNEMVAEGLDFNSYLS